MINIIKNNSLKCIRDGHRYEFDTSSLLETQDGVAVVGYYYKCEVCGNIEVDVYKGDERI